MTIKTTKRITSGYTIVELLIVIAIIGILAAIGIVAFTSVQSQSRNSQRLAKINVVSEALEKYYDQNGKYPNCSDLTSSDINSVTNILKGLDPDALITPSGTEGSNSFIADTTPTSDKFACIGGDSEYTLQYKDEATGQPISITSRRKNVASSYNLTITINPIGGGTVTGAGTWPRDTSQAITATANPYYTFSGWTGLNAAECTTLSVIINANKSCIANFTVTSISAPSAPVVTANTVGTDTTWSWPAVSCPGNTARYQYRYTISPSGYDSGWTGPQSSNSVPFNTATTNQTYTVAVQAQCYNVVATSAWGASGSDSYFRSAITYTLTYTAGANGSITGASPQTVGSGGSGTAVTAVPATYYSFVNWSDAITSNPRTDTNVTANKSVTANFIATPISAPATPTVSVSTPSTISTWSWNAASCGSNTARYQYRYTISPSGFDSGWTATSSTSVPFTTTTQGQTYTVQVQSQCYNAATTSAWSGIGSASYLRPYTYTLTLAVSPAGSGNVSQSGTSPYTAGSTPTINASANAYYTFASWTGTNCTGTQSHAVPAMSANMACTANFTPTPISAPSVPWVSVSTPSSVSTWSWGGASCPGNSIMYTYDYVFPGYDSGWIETGSTSAAFTTSTEGYTYTLYAQARCYNAVTTSGWSGMGSASYTRPYTYYTLTYIDGTGVGSLSGTLSQSVISGGSGTAVSATAGKCYDGVSWSDGSTATSRTDTNITSNRSYTANFTNSTWYSGLAGTQLEGQCVKKTDLSTQSRYKTTDTANASPQAQTGIDPYNSDYSTLVNPQTNPGVSFTNYPAQNLCKAEGGRLPWSSELSSILSNAGSYGNNFNTTEGYRSASQNPNDATMAVNKRLDNPIAWTTSAKTNSNPVRCVTGVNGVGS